MARKHREDEVLRQLSKKRDVKIHQGRQIEIISSRNQRYTGDLGNGSWGKIDFLVNHCGYRMFRV
jgi:hypothetical protein